MIRHATDEDMAFVMHAWVQSYADSDWALICTPKDAEHVRRCEACGASRVRVGKAGGEYWRGHRALIGAIVRRSHLLVAESDADGLLDGFACFEPAATPPVVHYVYVRMSARRKGVAKALLSPISDARRVIYTHRSRGFEQKRAPAHWHFDPYAIFGAAA